IISRFRLIARASRGTVLEDLCNRLTTDDGIHHGAGMAYEKVLLQNADKKTKTALVDAANRLLPTFVQHALWRPKERAFIGETMRSRDIAKLKEDIEIGVRLAQSLGLDVSDVQLPIPSRPRGGRAGRSRSASARRWRTTSGSSVHSASRRCRSARTRPRRSTCG